MRIQRQRGVLSRITRSLGGPQLINGKASDGIA